MKSCFYPANILLPELSRICGEKWATIACDQFTSEPEYWEAADRFVGDAPSALRVVLPEVYLSQSEARIPKINETMENYLRDVLIEHKNAMIYVEREQASGGVRRGIVGAVDLADYDYKKGSASLIRATEGTVLERIPPRVAVRKNASIELPHVMLLIDDREATVIEPLANADLEVAYDFELMLGGGHIKGYFLGEAEQARINTALSALSEKTDGIHAPLLFAVGDGNHSLATAKACFEAIREELGDEAAMAHPARYALCEVVNLYDDALEFEPIYRVMFGVDPENAIAELSDYISALDGSAVPQRLEYIYGETHGVIEIPHPVAQLPVGTLQNFIDSYIASHDGAEVDYIHGIESTEKLAAQDRAIGFIFDGMAKESLFSTVILDGALPRKTFSMGHARDKRFYLEARKIK